jgi:23S rRNA G2069 N7-methylase RlmK/C1962 C5-methylase RlmI
LAIRDSLKTRLARLRAPRLSREDPAINRRTEGRRGKDRGAPREKAPRRDGGGGPAQQQPLSPDPSRGLPGVFLRTPTQRPLVYRKRIARVDAAARPGDWVAVYAEPDLLLGYGVYNPRSEIAVRILRFGPHLPDESFWDATLSTAVALRRETLGLEEATNAYRVVHAEADGLSGVVIDRFDDVLSAEIFSLGMWQRAEEILQRCGRLCGTRHAIIQPAPQTLAQEGWPQDRLLLRPARQPPPASPRWRKAAACSTSAATPAAFCTCSGLLDWAPFLKLLHSAARQAGDPLPSAVEEEFPRRGPRPMQILAKTGAAMDHPIGASVPETEYLRAVWMRLG